MSTGVKIRINVVHGQDRLHYVQLVDQQYLVRSVKLQRIRHAERPVSYFHPPKQVRCHLFIQSHFYTPGVLCSA
jgi:hypothetical protein